jgi:hypothetical protein
MTMKRVPASKDHNAHHDDLVITILTLPRHSFIPKSQQEEREKAPGDDLKKNCMCGQIAVPDATFDTLNSFYNEHKNQLHH